MHNFPHSGYDGLTMTSRNVSSPERGTDRRLVFKEPDNAFITLERFQNEAGGGGVGVTRRGTPAAVYADWLRRPIRGRDKEERCCRLNGEIRYRD